MRKQRLRSRQEGVSGTKAPFVSESREPDFSRTSISWAPYMSRLQEEIVHFSGAYFGRCLEAAGYFACCRTFAELADAEARFFGDLLSDFVDEGSLIVSALWEVAPEFPVASIENKAAA